MASEFVSFMLVFGLGISMVVGITVSMQNISQSVFETSAEVGLEKVVDKLSGSIIDGVNYEHQWQGNISYELNLNLARLIVNKYAYQLSVTLTNGTYYLVGQTIDTTTSVSYSQSLSLNLHDVSIIGTISSTSSNAYILFTKSSAGTVVILGNR